MIKQQPILSPTSEDEQQPAEVNEIVMVNIIRDGKFVEVAQDELTEAEKREIYVNLFHIYDMYG